VAVVAVCPISSAAASVPASEGSSVAERNLDRITVGLAIIWIALIASLLILTKID